MKKEKHATKKEDFLKTLSSMTPEEVANFILEKSKIKPLKNIVVSLKSK